MGLLVEGKWRDQWYDTEKSRGEFIRESSKFHGVLGSEEFPVEPGRYHLYVSYACPWAHRTLIFRHLKGLEDLVGVSVVHPHMLENGWEYRRDFAGCNGDQINGFDFHHQLYTATVADYSGRVTVPVLWDKKAGVIVNNESAEIIRQFNSAFDHLTGNTLDFYPAELRGEIDELNQWVYDNINNGVYRAGFATSQSAYVKAYLRLFAALDELEERLSTRRYLCGERLSEADWRLFTTLVRFDEVYYSHFKCNGRHLWQYPNLSGYLRELYQWEGIADTVHFDHIRQHYYHSQRTINPSGIVPAGPSVDLSLAHGRDHLPAQTC